MRLELHRNHKEVPMKKQLKCYIYICASTSMQVDDYRLDAQKDKLHKYSGKSVEGRPQFQQMYYRKRGFTLFFLMQSKLKSL